MAEWLEIFSKALVYGFALVAVGAVTVQHGLLRLARPRLSAELRHAVSLDVRRLLRTTAFGVLGALLLRAWAHTASAFGIVEALSLANLEVIAIESRWAAGWHLQIASAATLCVLAVTAASRPRALPLTMPAVLLVCVALPHTGHPAGHTWRELLHAVHVLAGGAWLGTLFVAVRTVPAARAALLHAFAPIAMTAAATVGVAGLAMSVIYVGTVENLLVRPYGSVLLAKVAVASVASLMGALNWRRLRRGPDVTPGRLPTIEASLVIVIVVLTAWLSETAHP